MVADMSYDTVSLVCESWEALRRVPDYKEKAGVQLFRIFFEMEPEAMKVFSFGHDTKLNDEFFKSAGLVRHAKYYMSMVDRAIGLLGPDIELLTDIMLELGEKHEKFGVKPSYFPPMGQALISTMEKLLGDKFTIETKNAWLEVYQALAYDMIRSSRKGPQ